MAKVSNFAKPNTCKRVEWLVMAIGLLVIVMVWEICGMLVAEKSETWNIRSIHAFCFGYKRYNCSGTAYIII